ncbi:hypothetical protein E2C01_042495 [Portunus trituberculatus]|uniref:Uncharacterized protein n=1 Tax=Portunus trituberculatus TaxID=210409 RepID=A0A5B7FUT8_PORTR|nr:hypothetical protein [Portunus trituberculatus]
MRGVTLLRRRLSRGTPSYSAAAYYDIAAALQRRVTSTVDLDRDAAVGHVLGPRLFLRRLTLKPTNQPRLFHAAAGHTRSSGHSDEPA